MLRAVSNFFFLAHRHSERHGLALLIFRLGKTLAILNHLALVFGGLSCLAACLVQPEWLLVVAYGAGPVLVLSAFVEGVSQALMGLPQTIRPLSGKKPADKRKG